MDQSWTSATNTPGLYFEELLHVIILNHHNQNNLSNNYTSL